MLAERSQRITGLLAVLAAAATAAVAAVPALRFAYEAPGLRVALETAAALIALLAAYLMLGRFLQGGRLDSLVLTLALGVLALTNVLGALVVAVRPEHDWRLLATGGALAGSLLFAAAAFVPASPLAGGRAAERAPAAAALLVPGIAAGLFLADMFWPAASSRPSADPGRLAIESSTPLLGAQLAGMCAYAAAAAGFARRAVGERDSFLAFVAAATTLAAFARLHYVLFAPAWSGFVHTGDLFRVLFYAVLLAGAGREIGRYWHGLANAAVLEERRRISRELHDGVAQELAFMGRRARRLADRTGDTGVLEIAASAERALGDSRRAIAALTRPLDQPLEDVLVEAIDAVAGRHGVELDLSLARGVVVEARTREALVRIGCEAVSNAARHGRARVVRVELSGGERVRFAVSDEGCGFDTAAPAPGRFGVAIMRERAEAVGAAFRLTSAPGAGTTVEVEL